MKYNCTQCGYEFNTPVVMDFGEDFCAEFCNTCPKCDSRKITKEIDDEN